MSSVRPCLIYDFLITSLYFPAFLIATICLNGHTTISIVGRRGRDRMVVRSTTTCAISAYHHLSCEFEPRSWRGVFDATLCDNVSQ